MLPQKSLIDFTGLEVLVLGDLMLDAYRWGSSERKSPEADVPVLLVEKEYDCPGGAANVALNIKSLGANCTLIGIIGKDDNGKKLEHLIQDAGIKTALALVEDRPTTTKTRVILNERHLMRVDKERVDELSNAEEELILEFLEKNLSGKDVLILQDYNKGIFSKRIISESIKKAQTRGVKIVVDPKKNHFFEYKKVDLFKPNLKELSEAIDQKIEASEMASLNQASSLFLKRAEANSILLTLSEHGIYWQEGNSFGSHPANERNIVDVSGAGDTVVATAALALAKGFLLSEIAALSNLAGGLACEYVGVKALDLERLLEEV